MNILPIKGLHGTQKRVRRNPGQEDQEVAVRGAPGSHVPTCEMAPHRPHILKPVRPGLTLSPPGTVLRLP